MTNQTHALTTASTWPVILLLALAAFASSSAFRICDPLLPVLALEFDVRTAQTSGAVTYFAIAYGVMQFFYGPVGDRYGKFRVLTLATFGCAVGSVLVASAPTLEQLEVGRFISGATAAGIIPLSMAWIGDHVPYEQRQATLARYLLGSISGLAIGQLLGGVFADTVGWRWAFVFLAVVYLVVGTLLFSRRRRVFEVPTNREQGARLLTPLLEAVSTRWARLVLLIVCLEGLFVRSPSCPPSCMSAMALRLPGRAALAASLRWVRLFMCFMRASLYGVSASIGSLCLGGSRWPSRLRCIFSLRPGIGASWPASCQDSGTTCFMLSFKLTPRKWHQRSVVQRSRCLLPFYFLVKQ